MNAEIEIESNPLMLIVAESGVGTQQAAIITERFSEFFANASEWKAKAEALTVTDEAQAAEMKMARVGRLALRNIRISVEHTRKELKEEGLKQGRAIDSVAKALTAAIEPIERHLEIQETYAARAKASRDDARKAERLTLLAEFQINTGFYDLVNMPQADFDELLDGLKITAKAKIEAAAIAEAERVAAIEAEQEKARAEAAERARIQAENQRLYAEAVEREKAATAELKAANEKAAAESAQAEAIIRKERALAEQARLTAEREAAEQRRQAQAEKAKADELLQKERAATEQLRRQAAEAAADLQAKADAEKKARAAAEKKAAAAPDKVKLLALAATLRAVEMPLLRTDEASAIVGQVMELLGKVDAFIKTKAETL